MSAQIVNAAPGVIDLGTEDLSTVQLPSAGDNLPQHLPKFFTWAEKGPVDPLIVVGAERDRFFGTNTFDERGIYATHVTPFMNAVNANGNAAVIQRLIPEDAGPESNILVYLDVLPTKVDRYERNVDGSIKLNAANEPIIIEQIDGYKVKFVSTTHATIPDLQSSFGQANILPGDQVDAATNVRSQRYPIFEIAATSRGARGNNIGFRLWAPTAKTVMQMPSKLMSKEKAYPYFLSVIERQEGLSTAKVTKTIFGEQNVMVTFKEGSVDPLTDKLVYAGDTFLQSYENTEDLRYDIVIGDFGKFKLYQDNIDYLVEMFHAAEVPFIDQFSDFTSASTDAGLFNFVSGLSSYGVAYNSYVFVDAPNTTRFTEFTNVYLQSGSNGTMTIDTFNAMVKAECLRYLDPNDAVCGDEVANPESTMWDSGFPLDVKYAMLAFMAVRKDTWVVMTTYEAGERVFTPSEEHSTAIAIRTRAQMYPESDYFGTPVMRAFIFSGTAKIRNSRWLGRVPNSYDVLIKVAKYMGAGTGRWKQGKRFTGAPGHIIGSLYDISIPWIPMSVRNRFWDVGLNWVQRYDRRSFFFPAYKSVYDDDTSVLNSMLTVAAIADLNKIAHAVWRDLSGVDNLSNAQLIDRSNGLVAAKVKDRYDNSFVIVPDAHMTEMDALRGYSWTQRIKLYADNMRTVMTTYVQAYRRESLANTN